MKKLRAMTARTTAFVIQCAAAGVVALSVPVAAYFAVIARADRASTATWCSVAFSVALNILFGAPLIFRNAPNKQSNNSSSSSTAAPPHAVSTQLATLRTSSLTYLRVSFLLHLSWELVWLVVFAPFPNLLRGNRNSLLAYPWWVYIDAGDKRYFTAPTDLVVMEILSVLNGAFGVVCLMNLRYRSDDSCGSGRMSVASMPWLLGLGGCATVHLYSCLLYYAIEAMNGLPNCNRSSVVNVLFAFGAANVPWVWMPFVVFKWILVELQSAIETEAVKPKAS